jgi:lipopolysaccharide/colanic/teichoic acid biosynthesis glycosyltransferase
MIDVIIAIASLIVLAPLMIGLVLVIRFGSKGSAVFRQTRIGKNGKPFMLYKFRTMRTDVDPYGFSPNTEDDPRITTVGKFLRRFSLDELPQLINVLRGDMSMVGPRPLLPWQYEKWTDYQRRRCEVKPGLTGWAQIKGRGSVTHEDKIELDIWYVESASFFLDVKIFFLTFLKVLKAEDTLEGTYSREASAEPKKQSKTDQ